MLTIVFIFLLVLGALVVCIVIAESRKKDNSGTVESGLHAANTDSAHSASYVLKPSFLSPAELSFYKVLCLAVDGKAVVFAKVRLADIIQPAAQESRSIWQKLFNRISAKHVDFLICDCTNLKPLVVVELDDRSHNRPDVTSRDNEVNAALQSAGVCLVRFTCQRSYLVDELKNGFMGTPVQNFLKRNSVST